VPGVLGRVLESAAIDEQRPPLHGLQTIEVEDEFEPLGQIGIGVESVRS
jgi:hypothetical protein